MQRFFWCSEINGFSGILFFEDFMSFSGWKARYETSVLLRMRLPISM
jgi:hypothetical protein